MHPGRLVSRPPGRHGPAKPGVPYYAELFVDRRIEVTDNLEDHPRIGRRAPEADHRDDIRELIVQGYREGVRQGGHVTDDGSRRPGAKPGLLRKASRKGDGGGEVSRQCARGSPPVS